MAKGDTQNQINNNNQAQSSVMNNLQDTQKSFMNHFNTTYNDSVGDYNSIMNSYRSMYNNPLNPSGTGGQHIQSGPMPQVSGQQNDPNYVRQWFQQVKDATGVPIDPNYYADRAMEKGGIGDGSYWFNKVLGDAPGSAGGGNGYGVSGFGGGGSFSSPAYGYFQNLAEKGGGLSLDPEAQGAISSALGHYSQFADDGGFSPQAIQDLRARAIAPTRAVYANAQNNIDRQRSLQNGFSPNYTAATAKMARNLSSQISDANVNADASIAQMVQQGKEFGTSGLSSTGLQEGQLKSAIDQFNSGMKLSGAQGMAGLDEFGANLGYNYDALGVNARLGSLDAMSKLYGTTPGAAGMFNDDILKMYGLQNDNLKVGNDNVRNQLALNTQPNAFDKYGKYIGTGLSTAGALTGNSALSTAGKGLGGNSLYSPAAVSASATVPALASTVPTVAGISGGTLAGGAAIPGAATLGGGASSASTAVGGAGGALASTAAGVGIPLALMMGINKYTGGPSSYSTGSNYNPFGGASGVNDPYSDMQNKSTLEAMISMYGEDNPQVVAFKMQHGL
jgi:hypothetical protein